MLLNVLMKIEKNHFRREFSARARFLESVWLVDWITSDQISSLQGDPGIYIIYIDGRHRHELSRDRWLMVLSLSLSTHFMVCFCVLQNLIILWRVGFFLMLGFWNWRSGRIEDSLGQCPLHAAAKHGHAEVAHRLLEERAATWFRGSSVA